MVAERDRLPVEEQLLPQATGHELAAEHADRPGQRAWAGDDPGARRRHPVTARARDRPHDNHHGLARSDDRERLAHRLGGGRGSAARVDVQDHRRRPLVGRDLAGDLHDAQVAGSLVAEQRDLDRRLDRQPAGAAVDDRAFDPHQGDVPAAAESGRGQAHLSGGALPGADRAPQSLGQLLLAEHRVDGVRLDRDVVAVRRVVYEFPGIALARFGDRRHELAVLRLQQPFQLLAVLIRHLRLGQRVGRRLVGGDLDEVRAQPKPRQALGQEDAGAREAQGSNRAGRHQEDLVASAREVVAAGAVGRRPGDHPLIRLAELPDQLAQVLEGGHRHARRAEVKDNAFDAGVAHDGLEPATKLFDAQSRLPGETLPERARRVGKRREVFLKHENDVVGRAADRAADARDEPPQVSERVEQHPSRGKV